MRRIDVICEKCEKIEEIVQSVHDSNDYPPCSCGGKRDWCPTEVPLGRFKWDPSKAGKDTGVYEYDHGVRATWDLTVPGKIERLEKAGRIARNPFDQYEDDLRAGKEKPYVSPVQEV